MVYQRGYIGRGHCPSGFEPLLKRIAALPGDSVMLSAQGVAVNGALIPHSQAISCDVMGEYCQHYPMVNTTWAMGWFG